MSNSKDNNTNEGSKDTKSASLPDGVKPAGPSADGDSDRPRGKKPAGPPTGKKPAGPPSGKKPSGPPSGKKPSGKKPSGPGGKLPPGFGKSKKKKKTKSDVEEAKEGSEYLSEGVYAKLVEETDHFEPSQKEVIKHHGIYQQDDRDLRRKIDGKHWYFFVRSKIPGGRLTGQQYLVHDDLADKYGIGSIRVTTRQGIQIHGIYQDDLKAHIAELNEALVTTLGACGDVVRNTMCCPAPTDDPVRREIQELADKVSDYTTPQTPAYHDIWLKSYDEEEESVETIEKIHDGKEEDVEEIEPLYGKSYLPRKFKIGFAYPGDNCVDVYTHDIGFVAIEEGGELVGFNVNVGGSLGNTHNKPSTYPKLAELLGYVPKDDVIELVRSIIEIQREYGNRVERKQARMKYLVDDWGLEKFHKEVAERFGRRLDEPREAPDLDLDLHLGWNAQGDGRYYYGLSIENGRIIDDGSFRLKSGIRAVVERFEPGVHFTPNHDVLLTNLEEDDREEVEAILTDHGVTLPDELSNTQKYSMACPALPTCGLALTESERIFPEIIDQLEQTFDELGLSEEKLSIRMTGCPNGCARPYVSDIGIVGQSLDKYKIYVGGRADGTRLNEPYKELVDREDVVETVRPLIYLFDERRESSETFGDFCRRIGVNELESLAENATVA